MLTQEILIYGSLAAMLVGFAKTGIPGMGILVVPIMATIFVAKDSVGILLPMLIAADIFAVCYYREHTQWKTIRGLLPWVLLGFIPGAFLLAFTEAKSFGPVLGIIVLILLGLDFLRQAMKWEHMPTSKTFKAVIGVLTGFSTMVGNAAGPVMTIYLLANNFDKKKFVGSMGWMFLIINSSKVPVYLLITFLREDANLITKESLLFNLCMLPAIAVGAVIGKTVLKRIPQVVFKWGVLLLAALAALKLVL